MECNSSLPLEYVNIQWKPFFPRSVSRGQRRQLVLLHLDIRFLIAEIASKTTCSLA
jgi:hypothetical protein